MTGFGTASLAPRQVLRHELTEPLPTLGSQRDDSRSPHAVRLFVRLHGEPLGTVDLDYVAGPVSPEALASAVRAELGDRIERHLRADGIDSEGPGGQLSGAGLGAPPAAPPCRAVLGPRADPPLMSVVVPTCRGPASIVRTVRSVLASDYARFEVLVVDNRPTDPTTRAALHEEFQGDGRVRYLQEWGRGVSRARNKGMLFARGAAVAFTDDDEVVDRSWLTVLAATLAADPRVACVTGLVEPAELETAAQVAFEQYGGLGKGYDRRVFDLTEHTDDSPLYPYCFGLYGSGANMALRKEALGDLWRFDVSLGAGSRTQGGEDIDGYLDVLQRGHRIVYEPKAVTYHHHRRDLDALKKQMRGYGAGMSAVVMKRLLSVPGHRADLVRRLPIGVRHALSGGGGRLRTQADYPRELVREEWKGILAGPGAYLRSRLDNAWMTA